MVYLKLVLQLAPCHGVFSQGQDMITNCKTYDGTYLLIVLFLPDDSGRFEQKGGHQELQHVEVGHGQGKHA